MLAYGSRGPWFTAEAASQAAREAAAWVGGWAAAAEEKAQCDLLRDLFNPFRRPVRDRSGAPWLGDHCVHQVAGSIYDERRFDELPVLADALEDAGCGDA